MYKSPIEVITDEVKLFSYNEVFATCQRVVGCDVDKDELIRALRYDRQQYEKGYADGNADASQEWISVKDRLPELIPCNAGTAYSEAVIVWTDNRKTMIAVWDGIDFLCAADYWEAWGEEITHWTPLPQPPKGE